MISWGWRPLTAGEVVELDLPAGMTGWEAFEITIGPWTIGLCARCDDPASREM